MLGSLFPRLLTLLEGDWSRFIPWGLAINGIFSVVAANLGVLIYLFFGANVVLILGLACYGVLGVAALLWGGAFPVPDLSPGELHGAGSTISAAAPGNRPNRVDHRSRQDE